MLNHIPHERRCSFIPALVVISLLISNNGCRKFVEISPPDNALSSSTIFSDSTSISGIVSGIYSLMNGSSSTPEINITLGGSLSSDELIAGSEDYVYPFFINGIATDNPVINDFIWVTLYKNIYATNDLIKNISASAQISKAAKDRFIGEAKFIRAFCYFYLVNSFGHIPLVTSIDYRINSKLAQSPPNDVYQQIISDLKAAEGLLNTDYITEGRVRPNKWTAAALLARTYLYTGDYLNAELEASLVIESNMYSPLPPTNQVFVNSSSETIWQLYPPSNEIATYDGNFFIPGNNNNIPRYIVTDALLQAFETGDLRKTNWLSAQVISGTTYYYPYKYKQAISANVPENAEYIILFRLSEQYLIRAEARIQQNNISGGREDLNIIRTRAELQGINVSDRDSLLAAVQHERQVELFAEYGHRWFDLKRTGQADKILSISKAPNWQPTDTLFPIPNAQILTNSSLKQNPGY